jgi:hypothetical protein
VRVALRIRWVILSWESFVESFFVMRFMRSLGYSFVGVVRWIILLVVCGRLCPLCFMWVLGLEVKTLGGEFLKGIFAL